MRFNERDIHLLYDLIMPRGDSGNLTWKASSQHPNVIPDSVVRRLTSSLQDAASDHSDCHLDLPIRAPEDLAGQVLLGRFIVERKIGHGATSECWLARDSRFANAPVVVKVFRDTSGILSYEREVMALSNLTHEGVSSLLEYGELQNRKPCIVVSYYDGIPLSVILSMKRTNMIASLRFIARLAETVDALIGAKIVHGDIKPANIMVDRFADRSYFPTIIDFGGACFLGQPNSVPLCFTPGYSAPEVLQGMVAPQSDIYSLGKISKELLESCPGISDCSANQLRLMGELWLRTSAYDPRDRPNSGAELAHTLKRIFPEIFAGFGVQRRFRILMNNSSESASSFTDDIANLKDTEKRCADLLDQVDDAVVQVASQDAANELKASLDTMHVSLTSTSSLLRRGVFRLLVLGYARVGKSTLLNVLAGKKVLPVDVTECTGIITIIRYGATPMATVFFHESEGRKPETMEIKEFLDRYSLAQEKIQEYEESGQVAFAEVDHAAIELPLEILASGVELVDAPGINMVKAREDLAHGFIEQANAVLYAVRSTSQLSHTERQFIATRFGGGRKNLFFALTRWDEIERSLVRPTKDQIDEAESKVWRKFQQQLRPFFEDGANGAFEERVFKVSALRALEARMDDPFADIHSSGIPALQNALVKFLTEGRLTAEVRGSRILAGQAQGELLSLADKVTFSLTGDVNEARARVACAQPSYTRLQDIRHKLKSGLEDDAAAGTTALGESIDRFFGELPNRFEEDFMAYMPDFSYWDFLQKSGRDSFAESLKSKFAEYSQDRGEEWKNRHMVVIHQQVLDRMETTVAKYGQRFDEVRREIDIDLRGPSGGFNSVGEADRQPAWQRWAAAIAVGALGDLGGAVMGASGAFGWKDIARQFLIVFTGQFALLLLGLLNPVTGFLALLLGTAAGAANAKGRFISKCKELLVTSLREHTPKMRRDCEEMAREGYAGLVEEVVSLVDKDIQRQKDELQVAQSLLDRSIDEKDQFLTVVRNSILQITSAKNSLEELEVSLSDLGGK